MFKRVARQVRKSEKEDPVKAAGDSEEDQDASDVSEDSSSEEEESDDDSVSSGSEDEAESSTGKRKRPDGDSDAGSESGSESGSAAAGPTLTVAEALENPIFYLPGADDDESGEDDEAAEPRAAPTGCVLCPGKEMKNPHMVEVHLASKPHARALKRFQARIEKLTEEELETADPFEITAQIDDELDSKPSGQSSKSKKRQESKATVNDDASTAKSAKKREWKERTKEAKRLRAEKRDAVATEVGDSPAKSLRADKASEGHKNRTQRRIEALEAELGAERAKSAAGTAKGQERIKLLLEAKKGAGGGQSAASVKQTRAVSGEGDSSRRKTAKKSKTKA